ncbi:uncharacterized protein EAF01_009933 [Botrytis porri]|uniref:uncharacterized protein n=1 Tax=Botrytis porri TaxID=87229 RepID=UPI001900FA2C|nr:uncharacterized protein EAF01_009933 [Botrytis porri]KAF7894482.1 hypothetical protein EAF01_009933 [Botrytis porri]
MVMSILSHFPSRISQDSNPIKFEYHNLTEPDAIRLLIIHPGTPSSPIHCSLLHTSLKECRLDIYNGYTALSYVWGDPRARKTVFINERPFSTTVNLADAIDHLRDEERPLRLWADAICIDQDNLGERTQQLGLMREIYRLGGRTVIYLGEWSEGVDKLLDCIGRVGSNAKLSKAHDLAFRHVLSRPWFTRVWTYQELLISREVVVQVGRCRVLWQDFCGAILNGDNRPVVDSDSESVYATGLQKRLDTVMSNADMQGYSTRTDSSSHISFKRANQADAYNREILRSMDVSRQKFQSGVTGGSSLLSILVSRQGSGVSDFRDIIYGYLAVAEIRRPYSHGISSYLDPKDYLPVVDYTKSVDEVFVDAAFYIAISTEPRRLWDMLFYSETTRPHLKRKGLPSWVPDWTLRRNDLPNSSWPFMANQITDIPAPGELKMSSKVGPWIIPVDPQILTVYCDLQAIAVVTKTATPDFLSSKFVEQKQILIDTFYKLLDIYKDKPKIDTHKDTHKLEARQVWDFHLLSNLRNLYKSLHVCWESLGVQDIFWKNPDLRHYKIFSKIMHRVFKYCSNVSGIGQLSEVELWQLLHGSPIAILLIAAIFPSSEKVISKRAFARFSKSPSLVSIGIIPCLTKAGDFALNFYDGTDNHSCGVLRPLNGYRNDHLDEEIKTKIAAQGLSSDISIFHCTYIGKGWMDKGWVDRGWDVKTRGNGDLDLNMDMNTHTHNNLETNPEIPDSKWNPTWDDALDSSNTLSNSSPNPDSPRNPDTNSTQDLKPPSDSNLNPISPKANQNDLRMLPKLREFMSDEYYEPVDSLMDLMRVFERMGKMADFNPVVVVLH